MKKSSALARQRTIYVNGALGKRPKLPVTYVELCRRAQEILSATAWAYFAGGAGREDTQLANERDFSRYRLVPRMLRNVEQRDLSTVVYDRTWPAPLFLAPIGALELVHPQADRAVAQAAASFGIPYIFSNQASVPMETCAEVMGESPRWFQLYWSGNNDLVASLVSRAEACGCSALVLTLDTTMLGWRPRDLALGSLPFLLGGGLAQYTSDPVFLRLIDQLQDDPNVKTPLSAAALKLLWTATRKMPGNFWANLRSRRGIKAARLFTSIYTRPNLAWTDLPFLRSITKLPVILKGILHPDDARKALDYGIDGIYVSTHGGRQVDGSISALSALSGVVEAVRGKVPVFMDSGLRSGADVCKALALGATAVGIGRPYSYALALNGRAGIEELLENWLSELELNMALSGCRTPAELRAPGMLIMD